MLEGEVQEFKSVNSWHDASDMPPSENVFEKVPVTQDDKIL